MVNQLVNEFYNQFLFKMDALLQEIVFTLDIVVTFFKILRPDVRELLISEGAHITPRLPTETNYQCNQRLLLSRNAYAEDENKTRTIKSGSATNSCHPPYQDIIGDAYGKPLNKNGCLDQ